MSRYNELGHAQKRKDDNAPVIRLNRPATSFSSFKTRSSNTSSDRPNTGFSATSTLTSKYFLESMVLNDSDAWSPLKQSKTNIMSEEYFDDIVQGVINGLPTLHKPKKLVPKVNPNTVEEIIERRKIISDSPLLEQKAPPNSTNVSRLFVESESKKPSTPSRHVIRPHEVKSPVKKIRTRPNLSGVLSPPIEKKSPETSPKTMYARPDSPFTEIVNEQVSSKPKLLTDLENFLNNELREISRANPSQGGVDMSRLQVFRECFRMFVDQQKLYEPILGQIRAEFETAINYFHNNEMELESLRIKLSDIETEIASKTQQAVAKYAKDVFRLT